RKIYSRIYLQAKFPFGKKTFPFILPDDSGKELEDLVNIHRVTEAISIVEEHIHIIDGTKGYFQLPTQQVKLLSQFYQAQVKEQGGVISEGSREFGKAQYQNIIELTKQSLLDTLMELDTEFPDLINEYKTTKENNEKVKNIITNNIYGSNNPMNIAVGNKVKQSGNTISIKNESFERLKEYGIEDTQIDELKSIVSEYKNDNESLKTKAMKWLGTVSASVAAKGLYENIPAITEFVEGLI
ncbi:MAG: hypothetical protein ACOCUT_02950, partial [bacterium]